MVKFTRKANENGRRLICPRKGALLMDTTVLVLLIIILYLIKEIIRISNKKR